MPNIFAYQILPPSVGRDALDPDSLVLDNSANERPDWYEYWPIRKFLKSETLQEDAYYAFLSPRFKQKTNLRIAAVLDVVRRQEGRADILLFSPSLHLTAYYWNVFKYGEACHPGLLEAAGEFFAKIGQPTDLEELVTHSGTEVYSNYFFAKPRYWRAWLQVAEQLISIAESPQDPLGERLRARTSYRGGFDAQMKVFILERIPTWLLRNSEFSVQAGDPFAVRSRLYKVPGAIVCDALKIAYASNGHQRRYRNLFPLVSRLGKPLSLLFRMGYFLRIPGVRNYLDGLAEAWSDAGRR